MEYKLQPPWEFLLSASRNSLQSYELSRLSHAANLRKEIAQLLDSWLEENAAAMLARWLMEHRERVPAPSEEPAEDSDASDPAAQDRNGHSASYNLSADTPITRGTHRGRW